MVRSSGIPDPVSESESKVLARLCMLNDWVSLEFIRASLVTYKTEEIINHGKEKRSSAETLVPIQLLVNKGQAFMNYIKYYLGKS